MIGYDWKFGTFSYKLHYVKLKEIIIIIIYEPLSNYLFIEFWLQD